MIWNILGGPAETPSFYQARLKPWVTHNCVGGGAENGDIWAAYFGTAIWWIWRWRNGFVFDNHFKMPVDIGAFLQVRFDEAISSLKDAEADQGCTRITKVQKYVRWKPPQIGWYVLNCDGAAKGTPGAAGGGGVIRYHQGTLVIAYHSNFGHCNAYKAEVLAMSRGLEIARDLEITKLEIHMDNLACVQFFNSTES